MKSQLTFTPEVLTCSTLYNHCDYYYNLLVIYEHLEEQSGLDGHVLLEFPPGTASKGLANQSILYSCCQTYPHKTDYPTDP